MSLLIQLIFLTAFGYLLYIRLKTLVTYYQQEEYDGHRFLRASTAIRLFDIKTTLALTVSYLAIVAGYSVDLILVLLSVFVGVVAWLEQRYKYKKPLVLTDRARRILQLAGVLLAALLLLVTQHLLIAIAVVQLVPLVIITANIILAPFQARINERYVSEAQAKLTRMDPIRIGITGSFGKTTVKHMLAEILGASGPVFYSRGSINTVLGLTRHIRERLQWSHRYFIAEMGAYGEGSINRLCNFVEPHYGIVTAVGDAHTERFGGIDAIARAKAELAQAVCARGGIVVINVAVLAHVPFESLKDEYPEQIISVGTADADVIVSADADENGTWLISLSSELDSIPSAQYEVPLLGEHNVINSALAVCMALAIDGTIADEIPFFTKDIAQVPHRLQRIDNPGQALVLDDAYNANELGFKAAVKVLHELAERRGGRSFLVTPGITELGIEHDHVHERLGQFCNGQCDVVYAVNADRISSFVSALDPQNVDVIKVSTFADARRKISTAVTERDVVLYENDLPDVLEEKRFL